MVELNERENGKPPKRCLDCKVRHDEFEGGIDWFKCVGCGAMYDYDPKEDKWVKRRIERDKRFLGKEFDAVRAERIAKLAGELTPHQLAEEMRERLRKEGKLHPILDPFDSKTNKKLGKKIFKE